MKWILVLNGVVMMPYEPKRKIKSPSYEKEIYSKIKLPKSKTHYEPFAVLSTRTPEVNVSTKEKWNGFVKALSDLFFNAYMEDGIDEYPRSLIEYIINKVQSIDYHKVLTELQDIPQASYTLIRLPNGRYAKLVFRRTPRGLEVRYSTAVKTGMDIRNIESDKKHIGILQRYALQESIKLHNFIKAFDKDLREFWKGYHEVQKLNKEWDRKREEVLEEYLNKAIHEGKVEKKMGFDKKGYRVMETYVTINGVTMDITNGKAEGHYNGLLKAYPEIDEEMKKIRDYYVGQMDKVSKSIISPEELKKKLNTFIQNDPFLNSFVGYCVRTPSCVYYPHTKMEVRDRFETFNLSEYLVLRRLDRLDPRGNIWVALLRKYLRK